MLHHVRLRTVVWLAILASLPALLPATAAAQDGATTPGLTPRLLADASWHGRPIQRPLPRRADVADRAPSLRPGTGFRRPGGSHRVRDLQRRLTRLGYRPGTSDGLFGPRTQAALLAFQRKHGLPRTGAAGRDTLRVLRTRTAPGATAGQTLSAQSDDPPATRRVPTRPAAALPDDDGGIPMLAVLLAAAGAIALLAITSGFVRARTILGADGPVEQRPSRVPPPAPVPEPEAAQMPATPEPEPTPWLAPMPIHRQAEDDEPRTTRHAPIHHGPPRDRRIALRERILAMRAEGMTLQEIADQLTAEGEPTLGGGRFWQPWSVRAATRPVSPATRTRSHR